MTDWPTFGVACGSPTTEVETEKKCIIFPSAKRGKTTPSNLNQVEVVYIGSRSGITYSFYAPLQEPVRHKSKSRQIVTFNVTKIFRLVQVSFDMTLFDGELISVRSL